jgi:hypothetical protein
VDLELELGYRIWIWKATDSGARGIQLLMEPRFVQPELKVDGAAAWWF